MIGRPRLLDLFSGAGGAGMGYHRAGFEVVGVDIKPQPRYPFTFVQADALEYLAAHGHEFDAIHASPPCQAFTAYRRAGNVKDYPNLIPDTRALLTGTALPWVIENVVGAPIRPDLLLCGSMFDPMLDVRRHRVFESSMSIDPPMWPCRHRLWGPDRFPGGRSKERTGSNRGLARNTVEVGTWDIPLARQRVAMGIDWMTLHELSESIPPAYTEFIGEQLLAAVSMEQAS